MLSGIISAAKSAMLSIAAKLYRWLCILLILFVILIPLGIIIVLAVSPGNSCVASYQFDTENTYVNSKPIEDGIFGGPYNNNNGGENAAWHNTGLRTDGTPLILQIRGGWTAWDDATNKVELQALKECTMCAKKAGVNNCICGEGELPVSEKDDLGNSLGVDCSDITNQEDPAKCSCTTTSGSIREFGTYYIATDYQNKDESLKFPDEQESCRYTRGSGLYAGLFGKNGNTAPIRIYHIYPTEEICDIRRNSDGQCIDAGGEDQTKYLYRSPSNNIFIKDDKSGNDGTDTDSSDNEYHVAGELIKLIINDRYYRDNYGGYDVQFMGGFLREGDDVLLEYIVGTVEDVIMGKPVNGGKDREGGSLEFLYNSIVKDSTFIRIVQMCLILYVTIFGIYVLLGAVQLSRKEVMSRFIKMALVIFFTSEYSWYFYNEIVVGTFKHGMDTIISMFMDISDQAIDTSSLIIASQLERANDVSSATRFSYIDSIIKKLISEPATKKIWGLFFGEWFGMILIPLIYALIIAFILTMLTAAFAYISSLIRLIFALALGPIFMITVLYNKTDEIFKKWLSFMAARSVEIIVLFLVLYLFIILIDKNFTEMLSLDACPITIPFGLFNIHVMISESDRGFMGWMMIIFGTGALIWLLHMIMKQIPGFAAQMVVISGQKADVSGRYVSDTNKSAFGIANELVGKLTSTARDGVTRLLPGVAHIGFRIGGEAARISGIGDGYKKFKNMFPFRSPVSVVRDGKIDDIIKRATNKGKLAGKKGAELDRFIRAETKKEIAKQNQMNVQRRPGNRNKDAIDSMYSAASGGTTLESKFLGISDEAVDRRLNKALVLDNLKKVIKDESDALKKEYLQQNGKGMPLGKEETQKAMRERISKWADKNGYKGEEKSKFLDLLDAQKFSSLVKKHSELSSSQAAKMFSDNSEGRDKYLRHLQDRQYEKELKKQKSTAFKAFTNDAKDALRGLQRSTAYNPKMARENFLRKEKYEKLKQEGIEKAKDKKGFAGYAKNFIKADLRKVGINPEKSMLQRINILDKFRMRKDINAKVLQSQKASLSNYLRFGYNKELKEINKKYDERLKDFDAKAKADPSLNNPSQRRKIEEDRREELKKEDRKYQQFKEDYLSKASERERNLSEVSDDDLRTVENLKLNERKEEISEYMKSNEWKEFAKEEEERMKAQEEDDSYGTDISPDGEINDDKASLFDNLTGILKQESGAGGDLNWEENMIAFHEGNREYTVGRLKELKYKKYTIESRIKELQNAGKELSASEKSELTNLESESRIIDSQVESVDKEVSDIKSKISVLKASSMSKN